MAKKEQKKRAEAPTSPLAPLTSQLEQRSPTPEERAQIQAKAQRARTEVAVLKQRFAETDVALTIATAERDQLIQQLQGAQQIIEKLTKELGEVQAAAPAQGDVKDEKLEAE